MSHQHSRLILQSVLLSGWILFWWLPSCLAVQPVVQERLPDGAILNLSDVPPEVLQALYPQRNNTVRQNFSDESEAGSADASTAPDAKAGEESASSPNSAVISHTLRPLHEPNPDYFDQSASPSQLALGSSEEQDFRAAQVHFNEGLVDEMGTTNPPPDRQPSLKTSQPSAEPLISHNLIRQPARAPAPQEVAPEAWQIAPASHSVSAEPAQLLRVSEPVQRELFSVGQADSASAFDNAAEPAGDYAGQTLADLLADSNRARGNDPGIDQESASLDPPIIEKSNREKSRKSLRSTTQPPLAETIQRIAVSLCLVLAVACLLLVVAKRWLFSGRPTPAQSQTVRPSSKLRSDASSIQILNQLKLDAKSLLYLVEANEQQVLVAVDLAGIKSVVPLHSDFGAALNEVSDNPSTKTRSIVEELEEEFGQPVVYSPSSLRSTGAVPARPSSTPARQPASAKERGADSDVELEMKRKLAEILRSSLVNSQK